MPFTQFIEQGPARSHAAVTPSDTVDLPFLARALRIGGAGNVAVTVDEVTLTYTCTAGEVLNVCASRVLATGTTATGIIAWR